MSLLKLLTAKVASLFSERRDEGATGREVSRRGSTCIVRDYKTLMFNVVDIAANEGPEHVGEYAIYRKAVIAAERWEYSKRKNVETVPVLRVGS